MPLYAVVPVKNLGSSKRRLSTVFTPQERKHLTLAMLQDVLAALKVSKADEIVVVGMDPTVQKAAKEAEVAFLETAVEGLNPALKEAGDWCVKRGSSAVMFIPADLPLLTTKDINRIIELSAGERASVVLAPSSNWGTNALLQHPPKLIPTCFGPKSFLAHIREAYSRGVSVRMHFSSELSSDIDSADDLRKLIQTENDTACRHALEQIIRESPKAREFFAKNKKK